MAIFTTSNAQIAGLSVCVPSQTEDNLDLDLIPAKDRETFVDTIGVRYRRVAPPGVTATDLCYTAAQKLLAELKWESSEVDILIFISQTPDYLIPNSASILQQRLGLSKSCIAFDINLGCSGYVYGLSVVASLLQNMPTAKALLLVGDCSTSVISTNDKSTYPLFSDAGSATAIIYNQGQQWHFNLQTDGNGQEDIMIKTGGMRHPFSVESLTERQIEEGISRSDLKMKLDGGRIFNFALREVAANVQALIEQKQIETSTISYYMFHQANKLMIESIARKLKLSMTQVPLSLYDFGNTSSASIPMTISSQLKGVLTGSSINLLLSGFGVGLSWGSAYVPFDKAVILPVIELP